MDPDPASLQAGHELNDMTPKQAVKWLGLLVGAIAILFIIVTGFNVLLTGHLGSFRVPEGAVAITPNVQPPPAPRLETGNGQVLQELRVKEDTLLNNYTWIDQKAGVVRIPIDRAIELVAQRGLPTRPQSGGASTGTVSQPASSSSGRTQEGTP